MPPVQPRRVAASAFPIRAGAAAVRATAVAAARLRQRPVRFHRPLERLVEQGNSLLVIEHNLEVIKCADWIIDLGPEGGEAGGNIIAEGTPEKIARSMTSHTGRYLAKYFKT